MEMSSQKLFHYQFYVSMAFGLMMMFFPDKMLAQYKCPVPESVNDQTVIHLFMVNMGIQMVIQGFLCKVMARVNDAPTLALGSLGAAVLTVADLAKGFMVDLDKFTSLGMPKEGFYFNVALFGAFAVGHFMAWQKAGSPKPDLSMGVSESKLVNGLRVFNGICLFFGVMCIVAEDKLWEAFVPGLEMDATTKAWASAMIGNTGAMQIINVGLIEMIIAGGHEDTIYATARAIAFGLCMMMGSQAQWNNATSILGWPQERKWFGFVLHFGQFYMLAKAVVDWDAENLLEADDDDQDGKEE